MNIGDVVKSKLTGNLFKVLEKKDDREGFLCGLLGNENDRFYFFESEVDILSDNKEIDFFDEIEDVYRKKTFTIRMDITMEKEMSYEEAHDAIFSALRSAGMKGHRGGIA